MEANGTNGVQTAEKVNEGSKLSPVKKNDTITENDSNGKVETLTADKNSVDTIKNNSTQDTKDDEPKSEVDECKKQNNLKEVNKEPMSGQGETKDEESKSEVDECKNKNDSKEVDKESAPGVGENEKKCDPIVETDKEPSTVLLDKIKKQVEFYFGDVNMQRDKFLVEQTKLDDGWVPMSVMLNFKILASLCKDVDVILKALETSDLIEIAEDRKKIRRTPDKPLPTYTEEYRKAQGARTLYVKGFPLKMNMEQLKKHFENLETIENIMMRKYKKDKEYHFKGSIFLQFKTLEDAKSFLEQESVKYKNTELIRMWASDYNASKEKEREERLKKKELNALAAANKLEKNKRKNDGQAKSSFPTGSIIRFTGIKEDISREELKEKLEEFGTNVAYIDFAKGDVEGYIRLQGENSAKELIGKFDENKLKLKESNLVCKVLEGDEEEVYFTKIQKSMAAHRMNRRDKGRNSRKGGYKRRHSPHNESSKKTRLDN